jgi:NAD(P)-dependent dehydrogenase (short-subunit alcohol dehydrogenase family)
VDHLVNNASIWQLCKFEEIEDVKHFSALMDINFWGHVYPTRLAIPHLKRSHGRIVGVTSNSSYIFIGRNTFYNVSAVLKSCYCSLLVVLNINETMHLNFTYIYVYSRRLAKRQR